MKTEEKDYENSREKRLNKMLKLMEGKELKPFPFTLLIGKYFIEINNGKTLIYTSNPAYMYSHPMKVLQFELYTKLTLEKYKFMTEEDFEKLLLLI